LWDYQFVNRVKKPARVVTKFLFFVGLPVNIINGDIFSVFSSPPPLLTQQPKASQGCEILEVSGSHNDTPQSAGFLLTRDQLAADTST
jgi:hypothetical protein